MSLGVAFRRCYSGRCLTIATEAASRDRGGAYSSYDLKRRCRIDGRKMTKGDPSASGAGTTKAPLSSFFVTVRSPSESIE